MSMALLIATADFWSILLGAFLATGGGAGIQLFQHHLASRAKDKARLAEAYPEWAGAAMQTWRSAERYMHVAYSVERNMDIEPGISRDTLSTLLFQTDEAMGNSLVCLRQLEARLLDLEEDDEFRRRVREYTNLATLNTDSGADIAPNRDLLATTIGAIRGRGRSIDDGVRELLDAARARTK